ncbi:hypothetical protein D3H65_17260 [Paraflavitalea soli]|uniref:Uncharacterized protein n=1 Tax=Paraflavitalea soli TaxID=2315862 RepID=A0A3B7MP96_9BACT|nr:DUF6520 family protein [Paraflavitalea soli]AXY75617.1 hypothetical protein D3H65_17260 [Paraflavitalea soli]
MKKMKFSLMGLALVAALTSAFATRPDCLTCQTAQQYHLNNGVYEAQGVFGLDYDCDPDTIICTYYHPVGQPNVFAACRMGIWIDMHSSRASK